MDVHIISDLLGEKERFWLWDQHNLEVIVEFAAKHFQAPDRPDLPDDWQRFLEDLNEGFANNFVVILLIDWSNETLALFADAIGKAIPEIREAIASGDPSTFMTQFLGRVVWRAEALQALIEKHLAEARAHPERLAEERARAERELKEMAEERARAERERDARAITPDTNRKA